VKEKMKSIYLLCLLLLTVISGCSIFRGPPGPKLYDNVLIVINSDNTLLQQQSSDKEFKELQQSGDKDMMRIVRTRLNEFSEDELASHGDLKVVPACGPRTLKIIQDIESISVSSLVEAGRKSFTKSDDIHVSISTSIEDCESGKKLGKFSHQYNGQDLVAVVKYIASWDVSDAYEYQYGPPGRVGRFLNNLR
jgi:hypothetical protein